MKLSRHNAATMILTDARGSRVHVPTRRTKVALIAADRSYQVAPFDDPDWEVWSCNSLWHLCRDAHGDFRADRWFELHPLSVQTDRELADIFTCPVPLYLLDPPTADVAPNGLAYPLAEVRRQFPYRYFACTFAYQIALALCEGFETIGLFGVELDQGTTRERTVEKACVEFWIGVALGMGRQVITPDTSRLATQPQLYGYQYREEVDAVDNAVNGIFMRRLEELERAGEVERIALPVQEGHA